MDTPLGPADKKKDAPVSLDSKFEYQFPRRLIVCLDGTWNQRDSGTNIYHLSNLVLEGKIDSSSYSELNIAEDGISQAARDQRIADRQKAWIQMIYYDEGVGTSFLTRATGGAFGIGLSENVRQAYDWLVERYREGDHIFVFGFSRGAFTARSLVGLIASCGLLYRGAPLPPEELWNGYKKMGPDVPIEKESQLSTSRKWWQPFGHAHPGPFHRLKYLKRDFWDPNSEYALVPEDKRNETEQLLCTWSRRVPIECLAVYDTVRTLGIEALAIPWLRDRRSQFHDTRLTSLIRNGFHGLAIDEHRANFDRVPWQRATRLNTPAQQAKTATYGPIKQRWFIGAHSNIGGSYYDDTLAQWPLRWFIEECTALNLVFKPRWTDDPDIRTKTRPEDCVPLWKDNKKNPSKAAHICDSYTEFASGIWRHLIRAKRNYRQIAPLPEFQDRDEVENLHEEVHPSVWQLISLNRQYTGDPDNYNPPNLYEYCRRKALLGDKSKSRHVYLDGPKALLWLIVWLFAIGWGGAWIASFTDCRLWYWLAVALPLVAWVADWTESSVNYALALEPDGAKAQKRDGILDVLLKVRLAAIGLFVIGGIYFLWEAIRFLSFDLPLAEAIWLLVLCALMVQFHASQLWTAKPMREANFGPIGTLQKASTSHEVFRLLETWKTGPQGPEAHRLTPVYQTIWRDIVGFIPSYAVTFFWGLWILLSLILRCFWPQFSGDPILGLLTTCSRAWGIAAVIVVIAVVADYIEDAAHLLYLNHSDKPPRSVTLGRAATIIKTGFVYVGILGLGGAVISLGLLQFYRPLAHLCPCLVCRAIVESDRSVAASPAIFNFIAAALAIFIAYSTIIAGFKPERAGHTEAA